MFDIEELYVVENNIGWKFEETSNPFSTVDYSSDGTLVAFSNRPGEVNVVSSYDGSIRHQFTLTATQFPIAGVNFYRTDENLLLTCCRDGYIFLHNIMKGDIVNQTRHLGSNVMCSAVDNFNETFAIACQDGSIRLYSVETFQRSMALVKMSSRISSNTNVFSLVYDTDDSNILLSAHPNDRVLIWDLRTGNSEREINGPHLRGNGLDIYDNNILTVSSRQNKQIELWDFGTAQKIKDIQFDTQSAGGECTLVCGKCAKNGLDLVVGGGNVNIAQAFNYTNGLYMGQTDVFPSPVSNLAISPFGASFVVGTEKGAVSCYMVRVRQV